MMPERVSIAVVLLNWNTSDLTCRCLQLLNSWQGILQLEVLVVDNGSTDNSVSIITEKYPDTRVIENNCNLGFSGGNNAAFKEIYAAYFRKNSRLRCKYILLLNTDAGIDEEDLYLLVDTLEKNPVIAVTGPVIVDQKDPQCVISAGGLDPALYVNTYRVGHGIDEVTGSNKPFDVDYVSGTVALFRTSILEECGLFDEDYFFSCEMADFCERIKGQGYRCAITPQARAWHEMKSAGKRRGTLYLYYILRNRFLFIRKFRKSRIVVLFPFWLGVGSLFMLKALLVGRIDSARAIAYALTDGIIGRFGGRNELFGK